MKMRRLHYLRESRGLSLRKLGEQCKPAIAPTYICNGERWGHMYDSHLERLAKALGWDGDPAALMDEVEITEVG